MSTSQREDHLSDLVLDRMLVGELEGATLTTAQEHLAQCGRCADRHASLEADRAAFVANMPPMPKVLRQARPSASLPERLQALARRLAIPATGLALAAILMLLLRPKGEVADEATTRRKGAPSLGFYLKRGQHVSMGHAGMELHGGDEVSFWYSSDEAGYLLVVSVDGADVATVYHSDGNAAAAVEAGSERALEGSVLLDDTEGIEVIYGFFCREPITSEQGLAAIRQAAAIEGCRLATLEWRKVAR